MLSIKQKQELNEISAREYGHAFNFIPLKKKRLVIEKFISGKHPYKENE